MERFFIACAAAALTLTAAAPAQAHEIFGGVYVHGVNTPLIIDRYREATVALGYTGDSVLNSMSDIAMMAVGFFTARKLPLWASLLAVAVLEIVPLILIRDNLTLNVWMLLAPNDAVRAWQAGT